MQKLKIAVLDNGVDEKIFKLCGVSNIIRQNEGSVSDDMNLFLHGTNCAIIIGLNCANARLYSYKLLDNAGKGNVTDLGAAFDWCLMKHIRLTSKIHKKTYLPTHIFISSFKAVGLRTNSIAQCEQLCDVKDTDLIEKIGKVSKNQLRQITKGMQIQLGMSTKHNNPIA